MFQHLRVFLSIVILLVLFKEFKGQISTYCRISKVSNPSPLPAQVIFYFQCYPPTSNAPFVSTTSYGSLPTEFTQLIMNPNTYTILPMANICQFTNISLLDVGSNQLTSITGLFSSFNCLPMLTTLAMANNFIATPIKHSDFDDTICQQLVSLDLSYNQIPSIDSDVFIKSDGTTRFTKLQYLSLKNNQIKQFDLLWPLTIPPLILNVDMSSNPITTLVNGLNKSYSSSVFAYSMTGARSVNIQYNLLQTFSDSNLLQYGLSSANDLNLFFKMIANYDFRHFSLSSATSIICTCPTSGLLTVTWYQQLLASSSLNTGDVINQLYCSNIGNTYPLNINCSYVFPTTISTTIFSKVTTTTVASTSYVSQSIDAGFLNGTTVATTTSTSNYYYLFLLLIPLVLILCFILCCLRPVNKYLYKKYNTTCFRYNRPGENSKAKASKKYDATIVYSEADDTWVKTKLLPIISKQGKPYKLNLLTTYHKGFGNLEKDQNEQLNQSKRIILVISKSFLSEEWKSDSFQNALKNLCANDSDCVVIPIIIESKEKNLTIEMYSPIERLEEYVDEEGSCTACAKQIKYSTILDDIEPLNSWDDTFADDLKFLMPLMKPTGENPKINETTVKKREARDTLSPFSLAMESDISYGSHRKDNASVAIKNEKIVMRDDQPLINIIKKKNDKLEDDLTRPFNEASPREKVEKKKLVNRFLSPSADESVFKQFNKKNKTPKSPRDDEIKTSSRKTPRETEEPRSSRNTENQIPSKHTNIRLINPISEGELSKRSQENLDNKLVVNNTGTTSFSRPTEMIPVNANLNFNASSNIVVPVVSASSKHHSMNEDSHKKKHRKKNKNKDKRSRKSKTEEIFESRDYNILPTNEPGFISLSNDVVSLSANDKKKHRNHSNES